MIPRMISLPDGEYVVVYFPSVPGEPVLQALWSAMRSRCPALAECGHELYFASYALRASGPRYYVNTPAGLDRLRLAAFERWYGRMGN